MKFVQLPVFILILTDSSHLFSQELKPKVSSSEGITTGLRSEIQTIACDGVSNPISLDLSILPALAYQRKSGIRHMGPEQNKIDSLKERNLQLKRSGTGSFTITPDQKFDKQIHRTPLDPEVGDRWDTNPFTGSAPADNTIAISHTGWVVTGANSSICYSFNGSLRYTQTLEAFLNYPGWDGYCDPVVIFDPVEKRFIMYVQHCGTSSNNSIALLFSKTSNPNDGWYRYSFKGDQTGSGRYFDYPKLAVTTNEVILTGNLYGSDNKFKDALILQINKFSGYNGQSLRFVYWYQFDQDLNFTLLPVSYGLNNTYGPGVYLAATKSSAGDKIALYDLTDDLDKNPELKYYEITVPYYEVGSDAYQRGTSCNLNIGDCRALSGFYLNGIVHFVHAAKRSDMWNGVHYFRVDVNKKTATENYFGLKDYDYAYPAIASYASNTSDNSAMIMFARTASDDYPETRVVHIDHDFNWSSSTYVKGLWEVECFANKDVQRWGDYSGICRNYSKSSPSVMVAGAHGNFDGEWVSHAAEVHDSGPVATKEPHLNANTSAWPNPGHKRISITFQAPETSIVRVLCISEDGKNIQELMTATAQQGDNSFSMNTEGLATGSYILSIVQNKRILANEKIVILH